jgi:1,2-diacylglycerol 3-alpha-glucosyltransferase/glucuronosyltransferase
MRVLVATDAWHPQVNGVVRTYERLALEAPKLGFEVSFLAPPLFRTLPCPTYPEIRLSLAGPRAIARHVAEFRPDFIHIATEGPIGLMTRRYCRKTRWPFTTSYHTRFPEYVAARLPIPEDWCYALQRRFHNGSAGTFVATQSVLDDLAARGFERLMPWSRGVDTELFRPRKVRLFGEQPVFLYVGRIAVEKNIKAFLDLDLPGRKVLVGGGPQACELGRLYPDAIFTGPREGEELAEAYASADVFVFPSLTDTFGLVLLEALACGVPVAAYPVSGPKDVLTDPEAGVLSSSLREAALKALMLRREAAREHALRYSWENSARQFIENMMVAHNLGLPPKRARFRRWPGKRSGQKKTARLGGNRAVSLSCVSLGDALGEIASA